MTASVIITGTVLEVEHKSGDFDGRPYDFHVAHVLVGRRVVETRFNPDNGDARPPAEGATISLEVEVPKGVRLIARRYSDAGKVATPPQVRSAS